MWLEAQSLVLASRSKVRRALLEAAAIPVEIVPADIDERAIAAAAGSGGPRLVPSDTAALLAREKAMAIARNLPERIVLGADQTLALDDTDLHKPVGQSGAAEQLRRLRGRTHTLHSAVSVVRDGEVLFTEVAAAHLTMRNFSEDFLARYLAAAGDNVLQSVGGYQLEGAGSHLFERVEGDYFTVLGLPLLPLLNFFRRQGWVAE